MVSDEITGDPVFGQEIYIAVDTLTGGGFMYYNTVISGDGGYYEDIMQVPIGNQGMVEVQTMSCGVVLTQSDFFSPDTPQLIFDFQVCTDPSGNDCQAMFFYYPGDDPLSIQFVDESWGNINSWHWDFGDGTTSSETDPLHYYDQEGEYLTSLSISGDSCFSEYEMLVRVEYDTIGDCEASFFYVQGTAPLSIEFFDTSIGDVVTWDWDFGDGSFSYDQNPVHTYSNEGYYPVSLFITTSDSCFSFFADLVLVENDTVYCNAAFDVVLDTLNNVPHTYIFSDLSEGDIEQWYWDFGDGNFSFEQNPIHVYNEGGNYEVCLTVSSSPNGGMCTSTACKPISTLEYYNFGGQAFIGSYPINIDSTDDANIAIAYLYRKINNSWQYMDQREFWEYGYYWFANKPVGEYLIQTELKENSQEYFNYAPAYHMDAISWKSASTFILSNNQQFAVNVSFKELATYSSGIGSLSGDVIGGSSCDTIQNINTNHVLIQLFNSARELIAYTYSDVEGQFEFTGLGMGNYILVPEYTGRHTDDKNITLSDYEPTVNNIELTIHCSHILDVNDIIADEPFQTSLPYPAPASDYVNIRLNSEYNTQGDISIYNLSGNIVHNKLLNITAGNQTISIPVNTLPSGLYSMRVTLDNYQFQKVFKIIIIH